MTTITIIELILNLSCYTDHDFKTIMVQTYKSCKSMKVLLVLCLCCVCVLSDHQSVDMKLYNIRSV